MNYVNSQTNGFLVFPCGIATHSTGLLLRVNTKKTWYRLHQKKCEDCRKVRFDTLYLSPMDEHMSTKEENYLEKKKLENVFSRTLGNSIISDPNGFDVTRLMH